MKKTPKFAKTAPVPAKNSKKKTVILCTVIGVLVLILLALLILVFTGILGGKDPVQPTEPSVMATEPTEATEAPTEEPTEPEPTEPQMLPDMADLYAQNPEIVGWITIDGTKLDYAVMHTPEEPDKYDRKSFDGTFSVAGTPYLKEECSPDPASDNLIIYGHNMRNGTAFQTLLDYRKESFWEEHPTFSYKTLYEEQTYEIIAVFLDKVYKKTDTCFKYYEFIDAKDQAEFDEAIAYFKDKSLYDTGLSAEYGDQLISLVTCYRSHDPDGRLIVVGRLVTENAEEISSGQAAETVPAVG